MYTSADVGETSEKAMKKAAVKAEKEAKKAAREAQLAEQLKAAKDFLDTQVVNVEEDVFGHLPMIGSTYRTARTWTSVCQLTAERVGQDVWLRARLQDSRCKGER